MAVNEVSVPIIEYNSEVLEPRSSWLTSWFPLLRWQPTSAMKLKEAEENFIGYISTASEGFYVNVGQLGSDSIDCRIWTRKFVAQSHFENEDISESIEEVDIIIKSMNEDNNPESVIKGEDIPLVIVHGMGAGMAMFAKNIDNIVEETRKTIYCIDLPGFGRSSRPNLGNTPDEVDEIMVTALEQWRVALDLNEMYLLGHSFGGYLSALYTKRYSPRVKSLILADPWGMLAKTLDSKEIIPGPPIVRILWNLIRHFNPMSALRAVGPLGLMFFKKARADLGRKFEVLVGQENVGLVTEYLYHCNAHRPAGENAFNKVAIDFYWAKNPFFSRVDGPEMIVPCIMLLGSLSWVLGRQEKDFEVLSQRPGIEVVVIEEAAHHVYADNPIQFNIEVIKVLQAMSS